MIEKETFQHLISPVGETEFFNEYWDKKVLHISRDNPTYYESFLKKEEVDDWFQHVPFYFPTVQLRGDYKNTSDWYKDTFANGGFNGKKINKKKLVKYFENNHSILVNRFSNFNKKFEKKINALRKYFNCKNLKEYLIISPSNQSAFPIHYDKEHVFVFQIHGTKNWYFHDRPAAQGLRGRAINHYVSMKKKAVKTMQEGDFLYFPAGLHHNTETIGDENSISISIAVDCFNGKDVLAEALRAANLSFPEIGKIIPSPIASLSDKQQYFDTIKIKLTEYLENNSIEKLLEGLYASRKENLSPTESIFKIGTVQEINENTKIAVKSGNSIELFKNDGVIHLRNGHKILNYPILHERGLKFILENVPCLVKQVPLMLRETSKMKFISELVESGVIEVLES